MMKPGLGQVFARLAAPEAGKSKVQDLGEKPRRDALRKVAHQKHVRGLEIAVDHAPRVRGAQPGTAGA